MIALYMLAGIVGFLVLVLAVIGLRYVTRGTPVAQVSGVDRNNELPQTDSELFQNSIELLTGTSLSRGNQAEICLNGDGTYDRLFEDIASARDTLTLQMYYCQPGRVADRFGGAMRERARAGVRVMFLLDAFGSAKLSEDYLA
jgi:cardiolipin synthase